MQEEFNNKITKIDKTTNEETIVQGVSCFTLADTGKTYLLYKTGRVDNGYEIISAGELVGNTVKSINEEEWQKVKDAMKIMIAEANNGK